MQKHNENEASACPVCGNDSLQKQIDALRDLIEVAKTVVSTLDLDTLLQAIMVSAMHYAETPAGSVALCPSGRVTVAEVSPALFCVFCGASNARLSTSLKVWWLTSTG